MLHYYFTDKIELITYCVRYYKAQCVTRYDQIVATSTTADELRAAFADKLVETLARRGARCTGSGTTCAPSRCSRTSLRADVLEIDDSLELMIWRIVERYAELAGRPPPSTPRRCYAMLDGVFEQALLAHLSGDETATAVLVDRVTQILPVLLAD